MRRSDWLPRMWGVLEAARHERFKLGHYDCTTLVARVLDAMTDGNYSWIPGCYRDRRALKIMCVPGALEREVSDVLGEPVPIAQACRGDVVALDLELGPAIGICVGHLAAVAGDGVRYLPMHRAHCAWRVE